MQFNIVKLYTHICFCILSSAFLLVPGYSVAQTTSEWIEQWPITDFTQTEIELTEINYAGIPKDGIPALSRPRFVTVKRAKSWIDSKEPVLVVVHDNRARAYPLQILLYHQMVNDNFGGEPILITFCPLCNNGLVLSRRVGNKVLTFGTSGLLRNSGLIMFDRQTESLWQQFTGIGIVGNYAAQDLNVQYPSQIISFAHFIQRYPKGKVLSSDTGFIRQYGLNPFQGYDSIENSPLLFKDETDSRLPAMERVLNINVDNSLTLYPFSTIIVDGIINDVIDNTSVVVLSESGYASPLGKTIISSAASVPLAFGFNRNVDGMELSFANVNGEIIDNETESIWNVFGEAISGKLEGVKLNRVDVGVNFAFAALAFTPGANIYRSP